MATVSEVAVKYAARGAQRVQREDQGVRQSIQTTADVAREEQGTINRWMQRHQAALLAIGATTTAVMAGIISQSPALSAQLAEVRLGFSLLAMTIGRDVAPVLNGAGEAAVDLADAYESLPGPIRRVASIAIFFGGVLAMVAGGLGALSQVILGQSLAATISNLGSTIAGSTTAMFSFAIAIGALIGGFVVWLGHVTGVMGAIRNLGSTIGNVIGGPLSKFILVLGTLLVPILPLITAFGAFVNGLLKEDFQTGVDQAVEALGIFETSFKDIISGALDWGKDIVDNLIQGIQQKTPGLDDVVQGAKDAIAKHLSFDQVANDRMARRWGRDLVAEFSAGMRSARPTLEAGAPDVGQATGFGGGGGGGGDGGSNVTVVLERGAVQIGGRATSSGGGVDEREMAEEVGRVFDQRTSGRGRL